MTELWTLSGSSYTTPPILVPDGTQREHIITTPDGDYTILVDNFKEDPQEALLQVIEHNLSVMNNVHGAVQIIAGKRGNTTSIFFPDADPESATVDGDNLSDGTSPWTWDIIHDGTGNLSANDSTTPGEAALVKARNGCCEWSYLKRATALFDTSSLGSGVTIDSATISWYVTTVHSAMTVSVNVGDSNPASNTALAGSDWSNYGQNKWSTAVGIGSISAGAYTDWTLNATGEAGINKTGVTKTSLQLEEDFDDSSPSFVINARGGVVTSFAEETGTTQDPKLVVEHIDETAPVISNVQSSGITTSSATITWNTDESSDSTVVYNTASPATTTPYLQAGDTFNVTGHSVNLTGLTASTTYYYVAVSEDGSGNVSTSTESFFTTLPQQVTFARKSANESKVQDTTLTTDNTLSLTLSENVSYIITGVITATSSTVQPDLAFAFTVPTGSEMDIGYAAFSGGSTAASNWLSESGQEEVVPLPANTPVVMYVNGTVDIGSTSGNINFQWAQNTSQTAPTTILKGSYLRAERIE